MYYITLIMSFIILLSQEAYGAVLIAILFIGFYEIVVINKRYEYMKKFIEGFLNVWFNNRWYFSKERFREVCF